MSEQTFRSCYVKNANPSFTVPKHHTHNIPPFNKRLLSCVRGRDVSRWEGFYCLPAYHHKKEGQRIERRRHFNAHRAKAINALVEAMAYHLHLVSGTVPVSFTTLAEEAGLSTRSQSGNLSITRATRAAQTLAQWGVIHYRLMWDKVTKQYFPADIEVTHLFFDLIGVGNEAYKKAQNQQLAWINLDLAKAGEPAISLTEARRRQKQKLIDITWKRRKATQDIKAKRKKAKAALLKDVAELRHLAAKQLQFEMRQGLHEGIDMAGFKHLLNQRIAYYRKTASSSDPG
ncbi:plasmid replication initiator RepA [Rouxiella silvae]|uniref:plasmid replication initiator RepA n=1 Tax=Rouxiella silvae TaxID=1646373 RepID=UPI0039F01C40